ncbi:superoxide dismutase [Clostridia bacterium]|nr:superoxide dismutase [Clostridia bacterium]
MLRYTVYPFRLPEWPYGYDALSPYLNAETVYFHYDKHFRAYINNLNALLKPYPALHGKTLENLLSAPQDLPGEAKVDILFQAGGVYNHDVYFNHLAPPDHILHKPTGLLYELLRNKFGSFTKFKEKFVESAKKIKGSGWTVLVFTANGEPLILNLANQDTVVPFDYTLVFLMDVWEHSYYLQYQNVKEDYFKNFWEVLVFDSYVFNP